MLRTALAFPHHKTVGILEAAYNQVHFRLDFIMEAYAMSPDQTALILVHIVCNRGYLRTYADERPDEKSCD